ncbi:PREDICTED: transmembrane protein 56-B-like [Camelina sativa]|uniref:Transmembrane protein 56-B-like n=1 Tax=Camelina sativa TaxID=90675 RepID=A0ABM0T0P3_CAMSA|nr:PREDICTED: transmembrane protein 56-B-like [Camelina sativa]
MRTSFGKRFSKMLFVDRQILLLALICSGALMCIIVYDLNRFISPLLFGVYGKLDSKVRMEWNNRGFSTFHAILTYVASIYLLVISYQFDENVHGDAVINSTSKLSESVMGIMSLGYFLSDLAMMFLHFPALGGIEYVFHHFLSMLAIILSVTSGQNQFYIFIVLLSEATTPFALTINLRTHHKSSFRSKAVHFVTDLNAGLLLNPISDKPPSSASPPLPGEEDESNKRNQLESITEEQQQPKKDLVD